MFLISNLYRRFQKLITLALVVKKQQIERILVKINLNLVLWGLEINCNFGDSMASSVGSLGLTLKPLDYL